MNPLNSRRLAMVLLTTAVSASGVLAQSTPPAEDRSSTGAIELERSPVPAKRDNDAALPSQRMGAAPAPAASSTESRAAARARIRAEKAEKRAADAKTAAQPPR